MPLRTTCDASVKRRRTDSIDLFYQHRVDAGTPIEETERLGSLLDQGVVGSRY